LPDRFLIYGASGYTGRLTARRARALGLRPILAGRNATKLQALARSFDLSYRVVGLEDTRALDALLRDVEVVLHIAGPFSRTARPMVDACLRNGVHYLDLTGEMAVFEDLHRDDAEADSRGVMIMPGAGFVVVPSDCLAAHVAKRLPDARFLRIGISRPDFISRGTARTMITLVNNGAWVRREGHLRTVPVCTLERYFDYGSGEFRGTAVSMPDVFTAYLTTGIPNIEVYTEANVFERAYYQVASNFAWLLSTPSWQRVLEFQAKFLPAEPLGTDTESSERIIVAEAEDDSGRRVRSVLFTPDGYQFTPVVALAIVQRILAGEFRPGFQTPAGVYGADFVLALDGVSRQDGGSSSAAA
jgi:short subunit dehydrogenase-like uncharacterized protein